MKNIIAESLLLQMKTELQALEQEKEKVLVSFKEREHEIYKIRVLIKQHCIHDKTHEEDDSNYHRGEYGTKTVCDVCGITL